jgi:phage tail sheath protein FI
MLEQRTVPGVYIKELNAFPNSVVAVETALPVFIGYTQRVNFQGMSLQNKPVRIESLVITLLCLVQGLQPLLV